MRKQKVVKKKKPSGTIAIPGFASPSVYSYDDQHFPGCCGILTVTGFDRGPLGSEKDTTRLTRKDARGWWDRLCTAHGVACLMATTTPGQKFAETNLEAAGWKSIGRPFHSAGTGNAITIWQYLHSDWK